MRMNNSSFKIYETFMNPLAEEPCWAVIKKHLHIYVPYDYPDVGKPYSRFC